VREQRHARGSGYGDDEFFDGGGAHRRDGIFFGPCD